MAAVRKLRDEGGRVSWTVVDEHGLPIEPIDDFLGYLHAIERSPNSQRAYAYDLKAYFAFLGQRGLDYTVVTSEDLAFFVRHLRRPDPDVALLSATASVRSAATVNRVMSGVSGFYRYLEDRDGLPVAQRLAQRARAAFRTERGLLDGITGTAFDRTTIGPRLRPEPRHLEVLTVQQARLIIDNCQSLRDKFFFTLLATTGMRRGQALGLRHCDVDTRARTVTIEPRNDNANGARAKTPKRAKLPIDRDLARLYLDYMHHEYGHLDSDYVFVSLSGPTAGDPLREEAIDALVRRLRARVGFSGWSCHTFRHTFATLHHRAGMKIEIISHLLTHGSVKTTADIYSHLDVEDLRDQLVRHGCWATS